MRADRPLVEEGVPVSDPAEPAPFELAFETAGFAVAVLAMVSPFSRDEECGSMRGPSLSRRSRSTRPTAASLYVSAPDPSREKAIRSPGGRAQLMCRSARARRSDSTLAAATIWHQKRLVSWG